ncbi:Holliday junction resolvase RecU [Halobacillus litoralis]|uniref:Holliday junction resolvase RecU n=1 Tax=Halobacillus litoralis TaxID=45668 RepID=UPI001CD20B3B|nr:Holliday junction resolvase RecU [Halobacillus litoralis]MCA1021468.1 Holliday junction resolvase RecU [Halobacillus litoralis]
MKLWKKQSQLEEKQRKKCIKNLLLIGVIQIGNDGRKFEEDMVKSAKAQNLFSLRIKDVNVPPHLRMKVKISKNPYDFLLYNKPFLFPMELKSTKEKSFSYEGTNPKIKPHQIEALENDSKHDGVIAGFLLNFREPENLVYFLHINDFNLYRNSNPKKKSIPIKSVQELGFELRGVKKRTRYTYLIKELLDKLIKIYQ